MKELDTDNNTQFVEKTREKKVLNDLTQINVVNRDSAELEEIKDYQDALVKDLTIKDWSKIFLLMLIPIVNLFMSIIWAIGIPGENLNKRNFFRAYWLSLLMLILIFTFLFFGSLFIGN